MRKIAAYGHPRGGTAYFAKLMTQQGVEIKHEEMGRNGFSSWYGWVPQDILLELEFDGNNWSPQPMNELPKDYTVHILRNPFDSLESIAQEDLFKGGASYMLRDKILNLSEYPDRINRAIKSYLEWHKKIDKLNCSFTFRVEYDHEKLLEWLWDIGCPFDRKMFFDTIDELGTTVNTRPENKLSPAKPTFTDEEWVNVDKKLWQELLDYAKKYAYFPKT